MTRKDFILIGIILVISGGLFILKEAISDLGDERTALILIKGKEMRIPINPTDTFRKVISFDEGEFEIEVKDGKIRILEMDHKICPRGICSKTGWIKDASQTIVCLPNKISIRLINTQGEDIDSISS